MSGKFLELLSLFQGYMLATAVTAVLMTLILLLFSIDYKMQKVPKGFSAFLGVFAFLDEKSSVALTCMVLKLLFFVYQLVFMSVMTREHYLFLLLLMLVGIVCNFRLKTLPFYLLHNLLLTGGLTFANAVCDFINKVRFELDVAAVYWLWAVFLSLYAFYLFLQEVMQLVDGKRAPAMQTQ